MDLAEYKAFTKSVSDFIGNSYGYLSDKGVDNIDEEVGIILADAIKEGMHKQKMNRCQIRSCNKALIIQLLNL